ncbi:MAG: hypothetical protein JXD22_02085 [Sedimentisphaerales bacterium]|nr:hypothetical protein [Sedimentisphaerales bacterium]
MSLILDFGGKKFCHSPATSTCRDLLRLAKHGEQARARRERFAAARVHRELREF